jgi:hypothetical protein
MKKILLAGFCVIGLVACSATPNTGDNATGAALQNNTCSCRKQNANSECGCAKCKSKDMKSCECGAQSSSHSYGGHCGMKH